MNTAPRIDAPGDASLVEKARFLSIPRSYPHAPLEVRVIETHMSLIFLAEEKVFKLKKPVRFPFLDFSTVEAREAMCREEVRLNHRLAGDVYVGVHRLTRSSAGDFAIDGEGEIVDWLVEMQRLPQGLMLDHLLAQGRVADAKIAALARKLADFYRGAEPSAISPEAYVSRFLREQAKNREVLVSRDFALDHGRAGSVLDRLDERLATDRALLEERVSAGRIVDGHGDLRPEHICFTNPIVIFDCLEFNRELRQVDPYDELALLGVECTLLRAPWFGDRLIQRVDELFGEQPPARLISLYSANRAVLRARLAIAHLLDPVPRLPEKWEPLASRYLALAEEALS
jgi:aminoglycoside phosphotransferase family enzyme